MRKFVGISNDSNGILLLFSYHYSHERILSPSFSLVSHWEVRAKWNYSVNEITRGIAGLIYRETRHPLKVHAIYLMARNPTQFCVTLAVTKKKMKKTNGWRRRWENFVGVESCLHDSFLRRAVRVMYCWVIRACTSRASAGSPVQKRRSAKVCTGEDRHGHCASGPLYFTRLDKSDSHNWKCQHCWYIARFLPRRFSPPSHGFFFVPIKPAVLRR